MINLNINEKKSLQFDVKVSGVEMRDLRGSMKIVINEIQHGFPITIVDGKIVVEIPALSDFLKEEVLNEKTVNAKLEIIASDTYLVPWEDSITLESPVKVEAIMSGIKTMMEKITPTIEVKANPKVIVEKKLGGRLMIDVESSGEKKKLKEIWKKYKNDVDLEFDRDSGSAILDGKKSFLNKIEKEFKSSLPKKEKSKFAMRLLK